MMIFSPSKPKYDVGALGSALSQGLELILPLIVISVYIVMMYMVMEYNQFLILLSAMGGYFFPPLGKESVIPLAIAYGADPYITAISISMIDITLASFVFFNFNLLIKIPYIGPKVIKMAEHSRKWVSAHKRFEAITSVSYTHLTLPTKA